jgi:hypothetical protein
MNATPIRPDDDREALARLLPEPVERDLPAGRHRRIQEFVMSQIHQDLQPTGRCAPRAPRRRRVFLTAALTAAAAATAVAVVAGAGASGGSAGAGSSQGGSVTAEAASTSGLKVLLAAATTAERTPAGSGTYWHVKQEFTGKNGAPFVLETWAGRDGRSWYRLSSGGPVTENGSGPGRMGYFDGLYLGGEQSFETFQNLPADPAALKAWVAAHVPNGMRIANTGQWIPQSVYIQGGLVQLLSTSLAPPAVRATAYRLLAQMPSVKNLGPVDGGQGLLISDTAETFRLVIDPATSRVLSCRFNPGEGANFDVETAEWTNQLPK